jgi:hypothetical protein
MCYLALMRYLTIYHMIYKITVNNIKSLAHIIYPIVVTDFAINISLSHIMYEIAANNYISITHYMLISITHYII